MLRWGQTGLRSHEGEEHESKSHIPRPSHPLPLSNLEVGHDGQLLTVPHTPADQTDIGPRCD